MLRLRQAVVFKISYQASMSRSERFRYISIHTRALHRSIYFKVRQKLKLFEYGL